MKLNKVAITSIVAGIFIFASTVQAAEPSKQKAQEKAVQGEPIQLKVLPKQKPAANLGKPIKPTPGVNDAGKLPLPSADVNKVPFKGKPNMPVPGISPKKPISNDGELPMRKPGSRPEIPNRPDEPEITDKLLIDPNVVNPRLGDIKEPILESVDVDDVIAQQLRIDSVMGSKLGSADRDSHIKLGVYNPSSFPQTVLGAVWESDGNLRINISERVTIQPGVFKFIRINRVIIRNEEIVCSTAATCTAALKVGLIQASSGHTLLAKNHNFVITPAAYRVELRIHGVGPYHDRRDACAELWEVSVDAWAGSTVFDGDDSATARGHITSVTFDMPITLTAEIDSSSSINVRLHARVSNDDGRVSVTNSGGFLTLSPMQWKSQDRARHTYYTGGNCLDGVTTSVRISRTAIIR